MSHMPDWMILLCSMSLSFIVVYIIGGKHD